MSTQLRSSTELGLRIPAPNAAALFQELARHGYTPGELFLKLCYRPGWAEAYLGPIIKKGMLDAVTGSKTPFITASGIRGTLGFRPGEFEHLRLLHSLLPDKVVKPIALAYVKLEIGYNPVGSVIEYLNGKTLVNYYIEAQQDRSRVAAFVNLGEQIIAIINKLHEYGVGHCDLNYTNIIVVDGKPVLIDPMTVYADDFARSMEIAIRFDNKALVLLKDRMHELLRR
ncbi:MAG: lipopolysaccharide kinase InaA family protein [Candidatus Micrarchaeaceae archaeon]